MTSEFTEAIRVLGNVVDRVSNELVGFDQKLDSIQAKQYGLEGSVNALGIVVNNANNTAAEKFGDLRGRHEEREKRQSAINNKLFERLETLERNFAVKLAWVMGVWFTLTTGGGFVLWLLARQ